MLRFLAQRGGFGSQEQVLDVLREGGARVDERKLVRHAAEDGVTAHAILQPPVTEELRGIAEG
jgi:hypothetical protein